MSASQAAKLRVVNLVAWTVVAACAIVAVLKGEELQALSAYDSSPIDWCGKSLREYNSVGISNRVRPARNFAGARVHLCKVVIVLGFVAGFYVTGRKQM